MIAHNSRVADSARVVALIHVYYRDVLPEILEHLRHIPVPFDVIVTNSSGKHLRIAEGTLGAHAQTVRIFDMPNRGRDILPMLSIINAGLLDPYELVVKIHTKKSPWREREEHLDGDGDDWRQRFLNQLVGTREGVQRILAAFTEHPSLGLVTADDCLLGPDWWTGNRETAAKLLTRIGVEHPLPLHFASGSIYWVRSFVLNALRSFACTPEDFEKENWQNDNTTAHAIERLIGALTLEAGFTLREYGQLSSPQLADSWQCYRSDATHIAEARVALLCEPHALPPQSSEESPFQINWHGEPTTALTAMTVNQETDLSAVDDLHGLLSSPQYLHMQGKPVLVIRNLDDTRDASLKNVIERWRTHANAVGLPGLTVLAMLPRKAADKIQHLATDLIDAGCDGLLRFPAVPDPAALADAPKRSDPRKNELPPHQQNSRGYRYALAARRGEAEALLPLTPHTYPGVLCGLGDDPQQRALQRLPHPLPVADRCGSNPFTFRRWLRTAVLSMQDRPEGARVVFVDHPEGYAASSGSPTDLWYPRGHAHALASATLAPGAPPTHIDTPENRFGDSGV